MDRRTLAVFVVLLACGIMHGPRPVAGAAVSIAALAAGDHDRIATPAPATERSNALDAQQERIRRSIEAQWRDAAGHPTLDGLVVHWQVHDSFVPPDEHLEALREQVRADPAHPNARHLAEYERRIAQGTSLIRYLSLRCRGDGAWRLCQNAGEQGGEVSFVDYVWTSTAAWKLTPTWLVLIDATKPMPEGHPIPDVGAFFKHDLFMLLDGGLHNAALLKASLTEIGEEPAASGDEGGGQRWFSDAADGEGKVGRRFRWRWDDAAQRAFVEEMLVTRGYEEGSRWVFEGWLLAADRGEQGGEPSVSGGAIWFASRAMKYGAGGRLERVVLLEKVQHETPDGFVAATTAPWFGEPDALRGPLEFRSITDFRDDPPMEIVMTSDGIKKTPLAFVQQVSEQGEQNYRRLGWGLAGLAVVGVVLVRLHRGRGAAVVPSSYSTEKHR